MTSTNLITLNRTSLLPSIKGVALPVWSFLLLCWLVLFTSTSNAAGSENKGRIEVRALVLNVMNVKVVAQPNTLTLESRHIEQGYVDIEDASALLITSNNPKGFMMSMTYDPNLVARASATLGGNHPAALDGQGTIAVRTQQLRDEPMRVSYRLFLSQSARTGSFPWPVALNFMPRAV